MERFLGFYDDPVKSFKVARAISDIVGMIVRLAVCVTIATLAIQLPIPAAFIENSTRSYIMALFMKYSPVIVFSLLGIALAWRLFDTTQSWCSQQMKLVFDGTSILAKLVYVLVSAVVLLLLISLAMSSIISGTFLLSQLSIVTGLEILENLPANTK